MQARCLRPSHIQYFYPAFHLLSNHDDLTVLSIHSSTVSLLDLLGWLWPPLYHNIHKQVDDYCRSCVVCQGARVIQAARSFACHHFRPHLLSSNDPRLSCVSRTHLRLSLLTSLIHPRLSPLHNFHLRSKFHRNSNCTR